MFTQAFKWQALDKLCCMLLQAIGVQGLQQLDPARRDEYMRNVSSLEGLTSLAAAISRTSIMMLSEVGLCFSHLHGGSCTRLLPGSIFRLHSLTFLAEASICMPPTPLCAHLPYAAGLTGCPQASPACKQ